MKNYRNPPVNLVDNLRTLSHDLSNSLETILQASYLLGEGKLEGNHKKWAQMIDTAAHDATRINRKIREVLREQSSVVGRRSSVFRLRLTDD